MRLAGQRAGRDDSRPAFSPPRRRLQRSAAGSRAWFACLAGIALLTVGHAADIAQRTLLLDAAASGPAVVAVGERGTILRSTDGAHTWNAAPPRTAATLTGVSFGDAGHVWAVGHDATILASGDGGVTWVRQWQGDNLSDSFLDVLAVDAQRVIAIGAYGLCVVTEDGGRSWTKRKIAPEDYHLNRISRGPGGTLYIAGEHGTLLRSEDNGRTWRAIEAPYDGSFFGILPLSDRVLLAHGLRGRLYRSMDNGATWLQVPLNVPALLATALRLPDGAVVLAGQARALVVSTDGSQTFAVRDVGVTTGIAELLALPDGDLLAVGEAGATFIPAAQVRAAAP